MIVGTIVNSLRTYFREIFNYPIGQDVVDKFMYLIGIVARIN